MGTTGEFMQTFSKWLIAAALRVGAGLGLRLWIPGLEVSASRTTLHMGESVQLAVARKTWLGSEPIADPERTRYITNFESMAVVEPGGKVTAVGTWGKAEEATNVMAFHGRLKGVVRFSLRAGGPGPSLDFVAEGSRAVGMGTAACCSIPVKLIEGHQLRFRVQRKDAFQTDLTKRSTGTTYTLFFGSGVPNDPNPAQIIGYGKDVNPGTFRIDDEHGMIVAPASIGNLNRFTVLVFARNGEEVGWKQFQLVHNPASPSAEP